MRLSSNPNDRCYHAEAIKGAKFTIGGKAVENVVTADEEGEYCLVGERDKSGALVTLNGVPKVHRRNGKVAIKLTDKAAKLLAKEAEQREAAAEKAEDRRKKDLAAAEKKSAKAKATAEAQQKAAREQDLAMRDVG